jgi:hypothetical protein
MYLMVTLAFSLQEHFHHPVAHGLAHRTYQLRDKPTYWRDSRTETSSEHIQIKLFFAQNNKNYEAVFRTLSRRSYFKTRR